MGVRNMQTMYYKAANEKVSLEKTQCILKIRYAYYSEKIMAY